MNKNRIKQHIAPVSLKIIAIGKKYIANTWIHRLPITEWAYRRIFYAGHVIGEETIRFRGMKLNVHTKDISMVPALINNDFENYELAVFEELAKTSNTILDIGANIGIYSLVGSLASKKPSKIYAFEPIPENYSLLQKNLTQNKADNVHPVNAAVGDFTGSIEIEFEKDSIATHHISKNPKNPIPVNILSVDEYVNEMKLKNVDLIKMDIEGYEGYAIDGARDTLRRKDLRLIIEFSADFIRRSGKDPIDVANELFSIFPYRYFINEKAKKLETIKNIEDLIDYKQTNFLLSHSRVDI